MLSANRDIGRKVMDALNLPDNTLGVDVHLRPGDLIVATVEIAITQEQLLAVARALAPDAT